MLSAGEREGRSLLARLPKKPASIRVLSYDDVAESSYKGSDRFLGDATSANIPNENVLQLTYGELVALGSMANPSAEDLDGVVLLLLLRD